MRIELKAETLAFYRSFSEDSHNRSFPPGPMGKVDSLSKSKVAIRKHKLRVRRKVKKSSFLRTIWDYLTADSYMYGPLLSKKWHSPKISFISGKKEKGEEGPKSLKPAGIFEDFFGSPRDILKDANEPINEAIAQIDEVRDSTGGQLVPGSYMSVRKTITTTTFLSPEEQGHQPSGPMGLHFQDPATPRSAKVRGETELSEHEGDADEEHSWAHDGHENEDDFLDHIPLDVVEAEKVANQLIGGFGGRFSDDLGINVDVSDNEVESWFLAANFFCRSVSFDVAKKTYKELSEAGVANTADLLSIEESKLAEIVERTGYTKYGRRVASQLKKLATHLEENNWGRVSTFKHTSDSQELVRQLRSLPGVKLGSARIFLRELRGVWTGAPFEFDMKTKQAAMHLKLLGSIKASSNPEHVLSEFAQSAGMDRRDLEVALFKFGSEHGHDYEDCEGGTSCRALPPAEKLVELLPSDVLL